MTYSRLVMKQYNELLGILGRFTQHKMNMDEAIQEELTLVELDSHLRIEESLRVQNNDKLKGNNVVGPSVINMMENNNSFIYNDNKGEKVSNKANGSGTNGLVDVSANSLKGQNMFNKSLQVYYVTYGFEAYFVKDDDVVWWVDSRATVHVCKDRCWFKTYESLNDGSILYRRNESTALVHERCCVDLIFSPGKIVSLLNVLHVPNIRKNLMFRLNNVNDNIGSAFTPTSKLNDSISWHARLVHTHFKRMQDMSKDGIVVRFPDLKLKTLGERGIECIFVGYAEHYEAFRFYIIKPNESILINSIIESRDVIFDENRFSSVLRLSLRIPNGTEDIGGSVVPEEVTKEVVTQQLKPELRKGKRNRTPKNFGPEFQLYLIEGK
ncbi:hypothetical protein Tco_1169387 [Tanacetum coccineum]